MFILKEETQKQILDEAKNEMISKGILEVDADKKIAKYKDGILEAINEAYDIELEYLTQKGQ